jgi:hypothetical protein
MLKRIINALNLFLFDVVLTYVSMFTGFGAARALPCGIAISKVPEGAGDLEFDLIMESPGGSRGF